VLGIIKKDMNKIELYDYLDEAHSTMSRIYGKIGLIDDALNLLKNIGNFKLKNSSRVDLIEIMLKSGNIKKSLELYGKISNQKWKDQASKFLVIYYDGKKKFKEELKILKNIKSKFVLFSSLTKLKYGFNDKSILKFAEKTGKSYEGKMVK
jgi:nitroreductase